MKGLIIKDIFCLKKQIVTFAFIISGVVAVAVMFALSGQFGNLSTAASDDECYENDCINLMTYLMKETINY